MSSNFYSSVNNAQGRASPCLAWKRVSYEPVNKQPGYKHTFICSIRAFNWLVTSAALRQLSTPLPDGCGKDDTGRWLMPVGRSSWCDAALLKPLAGDPRPEEGLLSAYLSSGLSLLLGFSGSPFSFSSDIVLVTLILWRLADAELWSR